MLSIKSEHCSPHGKEAVALLAKLLRVQTNHLNQDDLQEIHAIKKKNLQITVVWK